MKLIGTTRYKDLFTPVGYQHFLNLLNFSRSPYTKKAYRNSEIVVTPSAIEVLKALGYEGDPLEVYKPDLYLNITINRVEKEIDSVEYAALTSKEVLQLTSDAEEDMKKATEVSLLRRALPKVLILLSPRSREIIERRFGLNGHHPHTLEEVGNHFGVTRDRVRQIEEKSLRKLRVPLEKYLSTPS